jgi:methylmalonic aciduria homocystinuria type C protein
MASAALVAALAEALRRDGLDIVAPLSLEWYNASVADAPASRVPPAGGGVGGAALVVVVGNSRALWPRFVAACAADARLLAGADPLEAYLEAAVAAAVAAAVSSCAAELLPPPPRVFWSHRPLAPGGAHLAVQRMAAAAGLAYLDSGSHLSLHPLAGPWFSLRAALVFDCVTHAAPRPPPPACPLGTAQLAAARAALAAAIAAAGDVRGEDAWRRWLAVRDAVAGNHPERYCEEQIEYHYTGRRAPLEAAVVRQRAAEAARRAGGGDARLEDCGDGVG